MPQLILALTPTSGGRLEEIVTKGSHMKKKESEPIQETDKGARIPVPKRGDFIRDLDKAAEKPPKKSRRGKRRKKD